MIFQPHKTAAEVFEDIARSDIDRVMLTEEQVAMLCEKQELDKENIPLEAILNAMWYPSLRAIRLNTSYGSLGTDGIIRRVPLRATVAVLQDESNNSEFESVICRIDTTDDGIKTANLFSSWIDPDGEIKSGAKVLTLSGVNVLDKKVIEKAGLSRDDVQFVYNRRIDLYYTVLAQWAVVENALLYGNDVVYVEKTKPGKTVETRPNGQRITHPNTVNFWKIRTEYLEKVVRSKGITEYNCPCWGVRGHIRHLKSGKQIYIKPYKKGKERDKYEAREYNFTKPGANV